jgi:hypothetical protein
MYVCMYVYIYRYMYVCMYVYIYRYICMHTCRYIYMYIIIYTTDMSHTSAWTSTAVHDVNTNQSIDIQLDVLT